MGSVDEDEPISLEVAPRWVRALLAGSGAVLLGAGTVAVFVSENALGTAALLAAGAVLVALGLFANNIRSIEGAGLALTMQATTTLRAAQRAESAGRHEQAEQLRNRAHQLLQASRAVASRYEDIRAQQPSSWSRTESLERVVEQARAMSALAGTPEDVAALFARGGDGDRVAAIGVMQDAPDKIDSRVLAEAVLHPRSSFEQYHALRAVQSGLASGLDQADADRLRGATEQALEGDLRAGDSDRARLARRILAD